MENVNILIVEDDEITATNLSLSLQRYGYNVVAICENVVEAKNKIKCSPDIILIDISLQDGNDGIELAKEEFSGSNIEVLYEDACLAPDALKSAQKLVMANNVNYTLNSSMYDKTRQLFSYKLPILQDFRGRKVSLVYASIYKQFFNITKAYQNNTTYFTHHFNW